MIQKYVNRFIEKKDDTLRDLRERRPEDYDDLVKRLIGIISDEEEYDDPDPTRITVIDHGHYQGTRLFIIGAKGYQPSTYWSIFVDYGSCSGCDSFEANRCYSDDEARLAREAQGNYAMLLHMVQSMREVRDGANEQSAEQAA